MPSKVYFSPTGQNLFREFIQSEHISLVPDLPLKIHPGAIGNTTYLKPEKYTDIIEYLKSINIRPYFIETCMASEDSSGKEKEFIEHGLTQIPHIIADGPKGDDHLDTPIIGGKHFTSCLIAKKLALADQVLVVAHFKGHGMAGFGGALKMLGIGFASGQGKTVIHSLQPNFTPGLNIDWDKSRISSKIDDYYLQDWNPAIISAGTAFRQRIAEYATAAAIGKKHLYLTFAVNLSEDCDCIDKNMVPLYPDLGVFASNDPVAIDKAVFDMLHQRQAKIPFAGSEIFDYAQSLGLGSTDYNLIRL